MTIRTLTPELAQRFRLSEQISGVVVTDVAPDSIAARSGIIPGDMIVSVSGKGVKDAEQFRSAMADVDLAKGVRLLIGRDGFQRFLFLREQ